MYTYVRINIYTYIHALVKYIYIHVYGRVISIHFWCAAVKSGGFSLWIVSSKSYMGKLIKQGTLPSLKLTFPPLKIGHPKRKLVFQPSISGAMLVSGSVMQIVASKNSISGRVYMNIHWKTIGNIHEYIYIHIHIRMWHTGTVKQQLTIDWIWEL